MSQNDFVIANQTAPSFRADLNTALQALASNSSGATAPSTTYANMLWYDTATNILKMRSEADDAWISLGTLDQSANTFTAGPTQTTGTWETGTGTIETVISPAKLKASQVAISDASNPVVSVVSNVLDATGLIFIKMANSQSIHQINGGVDGQRLIITGNGIATFSTIWRKDVVSGITTGANIALVDNGLGSFTLDNYAFIQLIYYHGRWNEIGRSSVSNSN